MDDVFNQLFSLVEQLQTNFKESETNLNGEYEIESDQLYKEYWHLVHDNFDKEIIKNAERKVERGNFITHGYVEALKQAWESVPRLIDSYQDYNLMCSRDLFGAKTYFIYKKSQQIGEVHDYHNDESAINSFRQAIDLDPNDPYFEL